MEYLIVMVPAIPLVTAIITYLLASRLNYFVAQLSVASILLAFLASLTLLWFALSGAAPVAVSLGGSWGILMFDPLSSLMSVVISGISLIVHVYSIRYMADEEGYARYYVLLGLMTSSLLLMVAAGDLLTMLTAWHLIGVLLYLLLVQNTADAPTQRYAMWTMLTYRLGDLPLVLAAAVLFDAYDTWSLTELFTRIAQNPQVSTFGGFTAVELAGLLIAVAAFARSAQFLLHNWLPYTMSGPTPVSALMHAGIVNAGGFLINRFAPLYMYTTDVLHLLFIVGLFTAIIGSVLMLAQNDIKKTLGYSTMGQMGFMIMECGVGAFSLAVFHLIAHGLFKGTMFLGAGGVIGKARISDGVPKHELYTFVVERQVQSRRQPWLVMAAITLAIPLLILVAAHWLVAQDYFQKQGAIVLLFFGWVTGAQLIFASYKMQTSNPWRLFTMIIASFAIVVLGYAMISHAFDLFLYPDPAARDLLYEAAGVDFIWFNLLVAVVTANIVFGWIMVYYAGRFRFGSRLKNTIWRNFYALISREFYVMEFYSWVARRLFAFAHRLNVLLRWV
ncbi:MAG: proton-conducting transporter membrane subunit [Gammaproteobacteria bacterium]|nr:proton-conducting transporter membrane subunit [Gammaproteobacteria bacterium]